MPPEIVHADAVTDDLSLPVSAYEFLHVNGFVYRCNKVTGEMWRLEAHATNKKAQVWAKIEDAHTTH